jgi:DNA-binding transcriptional LysR family regulator
MELRQLRYFVALAEELHYARAAARLGIDQSPLSRRIKEFEQRLGVLLFARTSRGTQLTLRGEFLLPWARGYWKGIQTDSLEVAQITLIETLLTFITNKDGNILDLACGLGASSL